MGRGPSIENRKNAEDARRGKVFTKLIREITIAARNGADPAANARLRMGIDKALAANMSKDTIERAVRRGSGAEGADNMQEIRYEGYGPGGVAIIIEALTDNRNRTASEVRSIFTKNGGALGETNSVAFNFARKGVIVYPAAAASADAMFEAALEAGAENVESGDEIHEVVTDPDDFAAVRDTLEAKFGGAESARLAWRPNVTTPVGADHAEALFGLIEALEDNDDVQTVSANYEVADEIVARLSA